MTHNNGYGCVEPENKPFGSSGYGAELLTKVTVTKLSVTVLYLDQESIVSSGLEYDEDTVIQFIGGFGPIKASGQVANRVIATRR